MKSKKNDGKDFEKFVFEIQSKLDPSSKVTHNQFLTNRFGKKRQFDVVIRGLCAGVDFIGVVECKDLNRKVGSELVDAFVTKANDINANFKILVSRKGFTKGAIDLAKNHGVQTYSLLPDEKVSEGFFVGNKWIAEIYRWRSCNIRVLPVEGKEVDITYRAEDVKIRGASVFEWVSTYLNRNHAIETEIGWRVYQHSFEEPVDVEIAEGKSVKCSGLELAVERVLVRKQKHIGVTGPGFYNWQTGQAKIPPGSTIKTFPISADFDSWDDAVDETDPNGGIVFRIILHGSTQEFDCPIDIASL